MISTSSPYAVDNFSCITVYKMLHDDLQLEPKQVVFNILI